MDRGYASQLQACFKATLLGLVLFSMVTWVPHACFCLRTFLFVSIPCTALAIVTPKCLFVFSNIIVIFLASESKLSHSGGQSLSSDDIDVVGHQLVALAPVIKQIEGNHVAQEFVKEEEEDSMVVVQETLHQLNQCEEEDAPSTIFGVEELREEESDVLLDNVGDGRNMEVEEVGSVEPRGEMIENEEECEEEIGMPIDELNKRVEDFIARFNMERRLEARMLVCCC